MADAIPTTTPLDVLKADPKKPLKADPKKPHEADTDLGVKLGNHEAFRKDN